MKKPSEKRKHIRFELHKECKTHQWEEGVDEFISDISNNGFKLHTPFLFELGEIVGITLIKDLKKNEKHIYLVGNIVRIKKSCNKTMIYGVKILDKLTSFN